jgi:hypothetical protein
VYEAEMNDAVAVAETTVTFAVTAVLPIVIAQLLVSSVALKFTSVST